MLDNLLILPPDDYVLARTTRVQLQRAKRPAILEPERIKRYTVVTQAVIDRPRQTLHEAKDLNIPKEEISEEILIITGGVETGKSEAALGFMAMAREACRDPLYADYLNTISMGLVALVDHDDLRKQLQPDLAKSLTSKESTQLSHMLFQATQSASQNNLLTLGVWPSTIRNPAKPHDRVLGWPAIEQATQLKSQLLNISVVELVSSAFLHLATRYDRLVKSQMSLKEAQEFANLRAEKVPFDPQELKTMTIGANPFKAARMANEVRERLKIIAQTPKDPLSSDLKRLIASSNTPEFRVKLDEEAHQTFRLLNKHSYWEELDIPALSTMIREETEMAMIWWPILAFAHQKILESLDVKNFTVLQWTWPPESTDSISKAK